MRYFPVSEYHRRWALVQAELTRRGFETAVVWGRGGGSHDHCGDILYLANHYAVSSGLDSALWSARSFAGVILRRGHEPDLHIDEPEPRPEILATERVFSHSDPISGLAAALNTLGVEGQVALVGTNLLPVKYYRTLADLCPQIEWVPADDLVAVVRRVKGPLELDCYREAGEIATEGLSRLMQGLVGGETEAEAAAEASRVVIRRGGRIQLVGCTHGRSIGYLCSNPLTGYSQTSARPGEMVGGVLHGPMFQGYYLDPGRTAVCGGKATLDQRELIEATGSLVERLIDEIRPGVSLLDVARLGDALTESFDGSSSPTAATFPFYGHGVGLFFENPRIGSSLCLPHDTFEAGMVFGVEAFLAREGVGSSGFEQNIIIHEEANELLTRTPMYWWD